MINEQEPKLIDYVIGAAGIVLVVFVPLLLGVFL